MFAPASSIPKEIDMRQLMKNQTALVVVAALVVAGTLAPANAQVARPHAAQVAAATNDLVTPVRWRGHRGGGAAIGAGIFAGALLGAGIAASRPYYGPGPYYYGPAYYGPPPAAYYGPPGDDDAVAYCMRRFKSYDPGSGTYLGYDGYRHPCP
jgi:hypothetical protein